PASRLSCPRIGLREHREVVHRLAQHGGGRRTGFFHAIGGGARRPVVGVSHRGERGVYLTDLPAPQVTGRLFLGFSRAPSDFAALDEFHDVVLPHRTIGQGRFEHVADLTD